MSRKVAIMLHPRRSTSKSQLQRRRWSTLAGAAAFVGAMVGCTSLAGASAPRVRAVPSAHPDGAGASQYLAGYQATPAGGVASASATFTVPRYTCTQNDKSEAATLDLGVYTDDFAVNSWISVICQSSGAQYSYLLDTPSGRVLEPAQAGDTVVTSLSESPTATFAELHDLTNGQYWFDQDSNPVDESVVDIGSLSYEPADRPVPTFPKATFSNATVNGDYLGFEGPTDYNALFGGVILIKSGHLATSATGSSFSLTFKHAS